MFALSQCKQSLTRLVTSRRFRSELIDVTRALTARHRSHSTEKSRFQLKPLLQPAKVMFSVMFVCHHPRNVMDIAIHRHPAPPPYRTCPSCTGTPRHVYTCHYYRKGGRLAFDCNAFLLFHQAWNCDSNSTIIICTAASIKKSFNVAIDQSGTPQGWLNMKSWTIRPYVHYAVNAAGSLLRSIHTEMKQNRKRCLSFTPFSFVACS